MFVKVELVPENLTNDEIRTLIKECNRIITYRRNFLRKHPPRNGELPSDYVNRLANFAPSRLILGAYELHQKEIQEIPQTPNGTGFIKN